MRNVLADNTTIMITEVTGSDQSIALLTKNCRLYRVGKPKMICYTVHPSNNKKVAS